MASVETENFSHKPTPNRETKIKIKKLILKNKAQSYGVKI
jgi:hypothetical protein